MGEVVEVEGKTRGEGLPAEEAVSQRKMGLAYLRGGEACKALECFSSGASAGDMAAMYNIGVLLRMGAPGVPKDELQGISWVRKAADLGCPEAEFALGKFCESGESGQGDPEAAAEWFRRAASKGHGCACYHYGGCLARGFGVERDMEAAVRHYRRGADAGSLEACHNLGVAYQLGLGVQKDLVEAAGYLRMAASRKAANPRSVYQLACVLEALAEETGGGDGDEFLLEAVALLNRASFDGCAEAMVRMGDLYAEGRVVDRSASTATDWYRKAANLDHVPGMVRMAGCLLRGEGLLMDTNQAAVLYLQAAEAGDAGACGEAGKLFLTGTGVERDAARGLALILQGAAGGSGEAMYSAGCLLVQKKPPEGSGGVPALQSGVQWLRRACAAGHAAAHLELGRCLARGVGCEADLAEAVRCYSVAAAAGIADAQFNYAVCHEYGLGGLKRGGAEALALYAAAADQGHLKAIGRVASASLVASTSMALRPAVSEGVCV